MLESDPEFKGYASGNDEPGRGFGHICIAVDDLDAACKRFDELGVKFKKRPEEGRMRVSITAGSADGSTSRSFTTLMDTGLRFSPSGLDRTVLSRLHRLLVKYAGGMNSIGSES